MTSPITRGWPTLTATIPNRRATIRTITTARKNAATSLLKSLRCLVAVNFSPDGDRPDGRRQHRLGARCRGCVTGVAVSSGISCTFCSSRSLAVAAEPDVATAGAGDVAATRAVLVE